jgi:multisubunit Na+/H+ antiporter MnhE subunit
LRAVTLEGLLLGLVLGALVALVLRLYGVRPAPWGEAVASVVLAVLIWLALKASNVDSSTSVVVAFVVAAILVAFWRRFGRRPA